MPSTTIELRPNRQLLDHEFEGYKLNLQGLPHWKHDLEVSVDRLYPDDLQYSYLHTKLFALHNHLVADYWDHHYTFYYVDKKQQVRKICFESDTHSFKNVIVYDVPAHVQRKAGHFNLCVALPASNLSIVSDGTGYLHIASTEGRCTDRKWETLHSSLVLGENKYFVIIDARAQEKANKTNLCCLLQSIEQIDSHFCSVLTLVTFECDNNVWKQISVKQLQGKGIVHYAAIESTCTGLYLASDNKFKFISDSEQEIVDSPEIKEEPKQIVYYWMQTTDDITITLKLAPNFDKSLFHVTVCPLNIKVSYAGNVFVDGKFMHKVDSELTTWNVQENGQVDILVTKSESLLWDGFLQGGDSHGQELLDASLVEEAHNRLMHLCSETEVTADQPIPAVSTQELEECDAASEEDTVLARFDTTTHDITHTIPLTVHQFLFSITVEAREVSAVVLRHDVDACIWQPYAKLPDMALWPIQHQGTLMAFGYVQSSKQNKKFVTCPSNFSYGVVCESSRHVFIYRNTSGGQLRQRSPGGATKNVKVGPQYVFNIDQYGEVLGINATNDYLFLLTENCMVVIQII